MEGRYHLSTNGGKDLDTNNLETYIKDAGIGLTDVKQKYPICVCLPPISRNILLNGSIAEQFTFTLLFVCTTFYTSDNQIKSPDNDTNTSIASCLVRLAGYEDLRQ